MLQSMHERLQGIIAGAIVLLICVTFALWGIENYLHGSSGSDVVAKVNGSEISQNDLQVSYQRARTQMMMQQHGNYSIDQAAQAKLKQTVLQQVINNKVLVKHAEDLGFYIGYAELNGILAGMPIFQVNGAFAVDRFQQVLSNMMYTETEFLDQLRETVMLNQLTSGIVNSNFILPTEVKKAIELSNQKRDLGLVLIPWQQFVNKVTVTDQDVAAYYQKHQQDFMSKETVSIQYLQLLSSNIAAKLGTPSGAVLKQYYQDNLDSYSTPKKWQLIKVTLNAKNDAVAKDLQAAKQDLNKLKNNLTADSSKTLVAPLAGQIVTLTSAEMAPEMLQVVDKLTTGQTSTVFNTPQGLTLVKVVNVIPAQSLPLAKVKDKLIQAWQKQKAMEEFADQSNKLADLTYTNSDSLEVAAQQLSLPIQTSQVFTAEGGKTGMAANPKIVKVAFSDLVLKQNYNSNPIEIAPGNVIVLRVKTHNPAQAKPLTEVAAPIKSKLVEQAAQAKALELANKIFAEFKAKQNYAAIVKQYQGLTWQTINQATRIAKLADGKPNHQSGLDNRSAIIQAGFALPMPDQNNKPASVEKLPEGDYAVVVALNTYPGNSDDAKANAELSTVLPNVLGQYEYNLLLANWLKSAKVKILDPSLANHN